MIVDLLPHLLKVDFVNQMMTLTCNAHLSFPLLNECRKYINFIRLVKFGKAFADLASLLTHNFTLQTFPSSLFWTHIPQITPLLLLKD